jgi:hypothetical protein
MARKRNPRRGARCAAAEMPDWRALALSVALVATLALALHP